MKPTLYHVGTRQNCPLPSVGKYWALRHDQWMRVLVRDLPRGGGTGCLEYAPISRRGYPYANRAALQDSQMFWGPLESWGAKPPRIGRARLIEAGAWLRPVKRKRSRQPGTAPAS